MDKQLSIGQKNTLVQKVKILVHYRELIINWAIRDIRSRYRQSFMGMGWLLIQPVFQIIIVSVIFGYFIKVPSEGMPYPIFYFAAMMPWMLFQGMISSAVPSVLNNMALVSKIYFPREILPLASILARFFDFLISLGIYFVLMMVYKVPLQITLVLIPVLLILQTILALGISLLGAAVSVFVRDISFAIPLVMQLWMYATPVIYPLDLVPEQWRWLYLLNPMAGVIDSYRRILLYGEWPDLIYLASAAFTSLVLCLFGYWYFKKLEITMADVL
ncbi:MAG TPA: ABC transporter permease [Anaerolineales bacterium]|nr:ABC transporter permease [Anaerolineales bacterium]